MHDQGHRSGSKSKLYHHFDSWSPEQYISNHDGYIIGCIVISHCLNTCTTLSICLARPGFCSHRECQWNMSPAGVPHNNLVIKIPFIMPELETFLEIWHETSTVMRNVIICTELNRRRANICVYINESLFTRISIGRRLWNALFVRSWQKVCLVAYFDDALKQWLRHAQLPQCAEDVDLLRRRVGMTDVSHVYNNILQQRRMSVDESILTLCWELYGI